MIEINLKRPRARPLLAFSGKKTRFIVVVYAEFRAFIRARAKTMDFYTIVL